MSAYKLYYFPIRGRGELSRLVFAAAGQSFEDIRVTTEEWPAMKPKTPTGKLPVLEVDGKQLTQSLTIARFLAKQFGLAGRDNWDQALVDQVVDTVADLTTEYIKFQFEPDEKVKEEAKKKLMGDTFEKVADALTTFLVQNKGYSGFFVGSELTLADLAVYEGMVNFLGLDPGMLSKFKELVDHRKLVEENVKVKLLGQPTSVRHLIPTSTSRTTYMDWTELSGYHFFFPFKFFHSFLHFLIVFCKSSFFQ